MATLELCVEEKENEEFTKLNRRIWPQIPSPCTVSLCSKEVIFKNLGEFIAYWNNHYGRNKKVKKCSCGRLFSVSKHFKQHLKLKTEHHAIKL